MIQKLYSYLNRYNVHLDSKHEDLVFKFSLMLLVLDGGTGWNSQILLRITCILMIVFGHFSSNKLLWAIISVVLLFFNSLQWYSLDNHKILFMYWVFLLTLHLWLNKDVRYIKSNATLLIGLVMIFAVLQKVINEFFVPGFLHGRFLFDGRFLLITHFLTDIPIEELHMKKGLVPTLSWLPIDQSYIEFESSSFLNNFTYGFQLFGLFVELAVGLLFIFSKRKSVIKDISLIAFCIGTYFIFPVIGFSSILLLLGIAQAPLKIRPHYILTFIAIQFIKVPWKEIIYYFENV